MPGRAASLWGPGGPLSVSADPQEERQRVMTGKEDTGLEAILKHIQELQQTNKDIVKDIKERVGADELVVVGKWMEMVFDTEAQAWKAIWLDINWPIEKIVSAFRMEVELHDITPDQFNDYLVYKLGKPFGDPNAKGFWKIAQDIAQEVKGSAEQQRLWTELQTKFSEEQRSIGDSLYAVDGTSAFDLAEFEKKSKALGEEYQAAMKFAQDNQQEPWLDVAERLNDKMGPVAKKYELFGGSPASMRALQQFEDNFIKLNIALGNLKDKTTSNDFAAERDAALARVKQLNDAMQALAGVTGQVNLSGGGQPLGTTLGEDPWGDHQPLKMVYLVRGQPIQQYRHQTGGFDAFKMLEHVLEWEKSPSDHQRASGQYPSGRVFNKKSDELDWFFPASILYPGVPTKKNQLFRMKGVSFEECMSHAAEKKPAGIIYVVDPYNQSLYSEVHTLLSSPGLTGVKVAVVIWEEWNRNPHVNPQEDQQRRQWQWQQQFRTSLSQLDSESGMSCDSGRDFMQIGHELPSRLTVSVFRELDGTHGLSNHVTLFVQQLAAEGMKLSDIL
ncbi:unnamed protein product [Vitrella brassicaformis CCMP3155]|uniref:Uncharacterized protein n=2 Tax=Vitrella brassicaformis TaxID=1169539 RepID=A0A0G4G0C0_VITBC|nr:unnamed protein product [Vitrella brassicaformis CCMP3155]|eukprot:CEM20977.1 unnamed protein product [Vitrella brassicaformis CCMP3155]